MSIEERVIKIVAEQLGSGEDEITNESSFIDDLGADSLDTVELVMAFEEEFNCEIPDSSAEKIVTVKDAVDFIQKQTSRLIRQQAIISGMMTLQQAGWNQVIQGNTSLDEVMRVSKLGDDA